MVLTKLGESCDTTAAPVPTQIVWWPGALPVLL
jgi:hypothetical protein